MAVVGVSAQLATGQEGINWKEVLLTLRALILLGPSLAPALEKGQ